VENTQLTTFVETTRDDAMQSVYDALTFVNYVEVLDGKITLGGGFFNPNYPTLDADLALLDQWRGQQCSTINTIEIERVEEALPRAWVPSGTNAWWQMALSEPTAIGLVQIEAPMVRADSNPTATRPEEGSFTQDSGGYDCRSSWLFKSNRCLAGRTSALTRYPTAASIGRMTVAQAKALDNWYWPAKGIATRPNRYMLDAAGLSGGGREQGQFSASKNEGLIVGVSNVECKQDTCEITDATRCDVVTVVQKCRSSQNDYWSLCPVTVDCKGKSGKYVYIQLPGMDRVFSVTTVRINRAEPAATDNEFVCYPVQARALVEASDTEYVTSADPENEIFYSSCLQREKVIEWRPLAKEPVNREDKWVYNGQCLTCASFQKASTDYNDTLSAVNRFEFTDVCADCDGTWDSLNPTESRTDAPTTQAPSLPIGQTGKPSLAPTRLPTAAPTSTPTNKPVVYSAVEYETKYFAPATFNIPLSPYAADLSKQVAALLGYSEQRVYVSTLFRKNPPVPAATGKLTVGGVAIAYEVSTDKTKVTVTATAPGTVWIAVGLGLKMAGGKVVLGRKDGGVTERSMTAYGVAGVGDALATATIDTGATFVQANGQSILTFTAASIAGQAIQISGTDNIIAAMGPADNSFGTHASKGTAPLRWIPLPTITGSLTVGGVEIKYQLSTDRSKVTMTATAPGTVWVAVGLGRKMTGGKVVLGMISGNALTVTERSMTANGRAGVGNPLATATIDTGATFVQANGQSILTFTAASIAGQAIQISGTDNIIAAMGPADNSFGKHASRDTASMTWIPAVTAAATPAEPPSAYIELKFTLRPDTVATFTFDQVDLDLISDPTALTRLYDKQFPWHTCAQLHGA
jgi:hypothetical protein